MTHQLVRLVTVGLGLCLLGLSSAADRPQEFRPAAEGYRYEFPRDHGSHDGFRTEWWYYTGNLTTKSGRQFGYQLTFFRRAMPAEQVKTLPSKWSITQLYLAHFAVSDLTNGRFYFAEKLSRAGLGKAGSDSNRYTSGSIDGAPNLPDRTRIVRFSVQPMVILRLS